MDNRNKHKATVKPINKPETNKGVNVQEKQPSIPVKKPIPKKGLNVQEKQKSLDIDTEKGTAVEGESLARKTINSVGEILKTLTAAVKGGQITAKQAREFRKDLGIGQSHFTRGRVTRAQRNKKIAMQKASRKANRGRVRGEKRTGGRR